MLKKILIGVSILLLAAAILGAETLRTRVTIVETNVENQKDDIKEIKKDVKYLVRKRQECEL